ncbi:Inner membrane symporter yicJ [Kluyvera cryocrescens]|uniref:Inner membrane symporter yicJ n=1 Tax=Kluyvera cryocrescens TaxID=580 RepID=A0A485A3D1_KLUCR|nr:Inner membrane symporter yicJ [Kluyvera cryocrescens]
MDTTKKLSASYVVIGVKEKIGYGFGDLASNLSFGFVSLFLLFFYTNIYGISAVQASLIFVIARVIDAIFNILIGLRLIKPTADTVSCAHGYYTVRFHWVS